MSLSSNVNIADSFYSRFSVIITSFLKNYNIEQVGNPKATFLLRLLEAVIFVSFLFLVEFVFIRVFFFNRFEQQWNLYKNNTAQQKSSSLSPKRTSLRISDSDSEQSSIISDQDVFIGIADTELDKTFIYEESDIVPLPDPRQFYMNLSNSSQYLRRDSFAT